jgi:hypothetical protein
MIKLQYIRNTNYNAEGLYFIRGLPFRAFPELPDVAIASTHVIKQEIFNILIVKLILISAMHDCTTKVVIVTAIIFCPYSIINLLMLTFLLRILVNAPSSLLSIFWISLKFNDMRFSPRIWLHAKAEK